MMVVAEVRESPNASAAREKLFISTTRVNTSIACTLSIFPPSVKSPAHRRMTLFALTKFSSGL
jgi:hypothetical protein